jgi:hypothetical protein
MFATSIATSCCERLPYDFDDGPATRGAGLNAGVALPVPGFAGAASPDRLSSMSEAATTLARPDAARQIVAECVRMLGDETPGDGMRGAD